MRRVGGLEPLRPRRLPVPDRRRRRMRVRLVVIVLLALVGAGGALTLTPSTAVDTLVSASSPDYAATQSMYRHFGSDPVVVLVRVPLTSLLQPAAIARLSRLEACLAGQRLRLDTRLAAYVPVPGSGSAPYGGGSSPCAELARLRAARVVYGPATFLNHAVAAVNAEVRALTASAAATIRAAEEAARSLARARKLSPAETAAAVESAGALALERELTLAGGRATGSERAVLAGAPSIADPAFLRQIVLGSAGGSTPSARFAYLFPQADAGVIQVRLRATLTAQQQRQAIRSIRGAVALRRFHIPGASYTVAGEPVLLADLSGEISGQLILLLAVAVAVMATVLLTILRRTLRLLPLAVAMAAAAMAFGLAALFGGALTVADVAVLPVLLGLSVDYGVQFRSGTPRGATAIAALATVAGFLALLISPVPMVRGFGLLLIVGVLIAFAVATLTAVPSGSNDPGAARDAPRLPPPRLVPQPLIASVYGAGEILGGVVPVLLGRPRRVLALAAALAIGGWALAGSTPVQSDITRLVPAGMPALRHLDELERATGSSGEVDVLVSGADVTSARTLAWMRSYERRMASRFGAGGSRAASCETATLCPALSLPALLQTAGGSLSAIPGYFQRTVLTANHRHALLAFGIRLMPLDRQRRVIERMRAALDPPRGTSAELSGLPVLAADAEGSLSSAADRLLMLICSLVLVAVALLVTLRRPRRVLVPLIPIILATGWSALLVYLLRIPLNPMSATLGTLVIAITTEFSVLMSERICRQLGVGMTRRQALDDAYRTTGVAVLTSALTAIAGFAVLIVSNIPMLRDFGLLALVDLSASFAGVMLVLPASVGLLGLRPESRAAATGPSPRPAEPALRR